MRAVAAGMVAGVEGLETLLAVGAGAEAADLGQVEDLVVHRPRAIGDDVVLVPAVADADAVGALFEQVDGRHAVQREVVGIDHALEDRVAAAEQQHQIDRLAGAARYRPRQSVHLEEQVALREGEVLLQQAIAAEIACGHRQQCFVVVEADGSDGLRRHELMPVRRSFGWTQQGPDDIGADQLKELEGDFVGTAEEDPQRCQVEFADRHAGRRLQPQADAALDPRSDRQRIERQIGREGKVAGFDQFQRPQRQVLGGGELAFCGIGLAAIGTQHRAARQRDAACEVRFFELRPQLGYQHRRRRRQILRIDHFQQPLRKARELCVETQLHTRRHEGHALEQALDVRVGHFDAVHPESIGDLRKLTSELRAHLAQMLEFLVVVAQQPWIHVVPVSMTPGSSRPVGDSLQRHQFASSTCTCPLSRSNSVRSSISSGTGCAHSCAEMRMLMMLCQSSTLLSSTTSIFSDSGSRRGS